MKHQPFEAWIFSDEILADGEQRALDEHLHDCESCRSLQDADRTLTGMLESAPTLAPAPGFRARFAYRLEEERRFRRLVRALMIGGVLLMLMAIVSLLIGGLLFTRVVLVNRAVTQVGQFLVRVGFQASLSIRVLTLVAGALLRTLPQASLFAVSIASVGLTSLWLFSLYRISSQPVRR